MATKQLPVVPPHVQGAGLAELIKHVQLTVKSDLVEFNGDTAINLFEVPGNIVIEELLVNVTEAFDASGSSAAATATLSVPGDTGAIVVFDAANVSLQSLTTAAYLPSTNAGPIKVPSSGGVVSLALDPSTSTVGQLEVYMKYLPNVDDL